jgi:hypothetical protein
MGLKRVGAHVLPVRFKGRSYELRTRDMHFDGITMVYIDTMEGDDPKVGRSEYEQLRELVRKLHTQGEQNGVVLSMTMFERILQAIASALLHEGRE